MCWRHDCRLGEHFQQEFTVQAGLLSDGDCLRDRLHVQTEQSVDDQLHRGPGTARTQKEILFRYCRKDWLAFVEYLRVAATEQRQRSTLRGRGAAGNRNVQDFDPALDAHPMKLSRR